MISEQQNGEILLYINYSESLGKCMAVRHGSIIFGLLNTMLSDVARRPLGSQDTSLKTERGLPGTGSLSIVDHPAVGGGF